jgi:hypothetical protein
MGQEPSKRVSVRNLLEAAIEDDDADHAAKVIREALGIESDEVVGFSFPKNWPQDRDQRARIIGEWLRDEARFLTECPHE